MEETCSMCGEKTGEMDSVIVITREPGKKAKYFEPETIAVLCVECYNGGTSQRPVNLNDLPYV